MWKLKNSEGTEQLCHTLDEVVTIILNAPILLEYTLKFIPLYEKPKPSRPPGSFGFPISLPGTTQD